MSKSSGEELYSRWLTEMARTDYSEREFFLDQEAERLEIKVTKKELARFRVILRAATCDSGWPVRNKAAEYLIKFGARGDLFCLVARCKDPEWVVRASATNAIGVVFPRSTLKHVLPLLDDPHCVVRRYAIFALWEALKHDVEPLARKALAKDSDSVARVGYIAVLAFCGDQEALIELSEMAKNEDRWISGPAEDALMDIERAAKLEKSP